jgi:hypothetical protein
MAVPAFYEPPLSVGDQRVLFLVRAHAVPWGRRCAPPRPPWLAVGLGGHEHSDRRGRAAAPAGNGAQGGITMSYGSSCLHG